MRSATCPSSAIARFRRTTLLLLGVLPLLCGCTGMARGFSMTPKPPDAGREVHARYYHFNLFGMFPATEVSGLLEDLMVQCPHQNVVGISTEYVNTDEVLGIGEEFRIYGYCLEKEGK